MVALEEEKNSITWSLIKTKSDTSMKLTYIYVKRAPKTEKYPHGLFYLGKTVAKNPFLYKGGGTRWNNYIKKYNFKLEDIDTWILHQTSSKEDLRNMGIYYSNLFNVVENNDWANLKPEIGDGGQSKGFMKDDPKHPAKRVETRQKISETLLGESNWMRGKIGQQSPMWGYKHTKESIEKIKSAALKSANRIQVNQYTKEGVFIKTWDSISQASTELNIWHIGSVCSGHRKYAGGFIWKKVI